MECKNFEAQYLKTAQNADRTLYNSKVAICHDTFIMTA